MDINHLNLRVRSVERSREFYASHFGLRDWVWHGDVLFMRDDAGMDLALDPSEGGALSPEGFHFGFRLTDSTAVEELRATLVAAGVPVREPLTREDNLVYFRCVDPDGYGIEVYWEPDPDKARSGDEPYMNRNR